MTTTENTPLASSGRTMRIFTALALPVFISLYAAVAHASLVGDTVILNHATPFDDSCPVCLSDVSVLVEAGPGDINSPNPTSYLVDMEGESIVLVDPDPTQGGGYWTPTVFNGPVISDLDWSGEPNRKLVGVIVDTNLPDWTEDRVVFGDDFVGFNLQSIGLDHEIPAEWFLRATLVAVPEPTSLAMVSVAAAGLCWIGRRRVNRSAAAHPIRDSLTSSVPPSAS